VLGRLVGRCDECVCGLPGEQGEGASVHRELCRPRAGPDERHESIRKRHDERPRETNRAGNAERVRARELHQSDVRHVQRQSGAQGQKRFTPAPRAQCARLCSERRRHRLVLGESDGHRRDGHVRRRTRALVLQGQLRQGERRRDDLAQRPDQILSKPCCAR
jgi:hypothetical protein